MHTVKTTVLTRVFGITSPSGDTMVQIFPNAGVMHPEIRMGERIDVLFYPDSTAALMNALASHVNSHDGEWTQEI